MGWIDENEKMEEHREIRWMTRMERKLGKKNQELDDDEDCLV